MLRLTAAFSLVFVLAATATRADDTPLPPGFDRINTIVVVYAENRSFVHLLPDRPGTFGIAQAPEASVVQATATARCSLAAAGVEGRREPRRRTPPTPSRCPTGPSTSPHRPTIFPPT
jgi:phospholipase C